MRSAAFLVVLAGCGSPRAVPARPGPAPEPIAPAPVAAPTDVVDSGVFLMTAGEMLTREEFTIRKVPTGFVVRVKTTQPDSDNGSDGELEVDAQWRPVRAAYRQLTTADGLTHKLGGTPLTLEVTRDDGRDPRKVVANRPVDAYLEGPGIVGMTALCRVEGEKMLTTIGASDNGLLDYLGVAAMAEGAHKRVVLDMSGLGFELLCDGDKLLAGGVRDYDIWFVRDGRRSELDVLKKLAAPPKTTWAYPQDENEPWKAYTALLVEKNIVAIVDARRRVKRVTSFDTKGARLAHRDYKTEPGSYVTCEALAKQRIACLHPTGGVLEILDAKTLNPVADLGALVKKAAPASDSARWWFNEVGGDRVEVTVSDTEMVRLDVGKGTSTVVPRPQQLLPSWKNPNACNTYLGEGRKIGGAVWKFDPSPEGTKLLRKAGKKDLPPVEVPLRYPSLLECSPTGGGAFAVTHDGTDSVLASLAADAKLRWKVALDGHPERVWRVGELLLVSTGETTGRIVAVDAKKGAIVWKAASPPVAKN